MLLKCGRLFNSLYYKNVCIWWNKAVSRMGNILYTQPKDIVDSYLEWLAIVILLCTHVLNDVGHAKTPMC